MTENPSGDNLTSVVIQTIRELPGQINALAREMADLKTTIAKMEVIHMTKQDVQALLRENEKERSLLEQRLRRETSDSINRLNTNLSNTWGEVQDHIEALQADVTLLKASQAGIIAEQERQHKILHGNGNPSLLEMVRKAMDTANKNSDNILKVSAVLAKLVEEDNIRKYREHQTNKFVEFIVEHGPVLSTVIGIIITAFSTGLLYLQEVSYEQLYLFGGFSAAVTVVIVFMLSLLKRWTKRGNDDG